MNFGSNSIHKSSIVEGNVVMGDNNIIESNVLLRGPLFIGSNNYIGHGSVIGTAGENTKDPHKITDNMPIKIGNRCIIKENVVIHKPCFGEITFVADDVFIMHGSHIAHDCKIHNKAVITPNSTLGGIVTVCEGANIALACTVHQYTVIGHYSIAAMGSVITKNIKPFTKYIKGKPNSVNDYAIKKFGFQGVADEISEYVLRDKFPSNKKLISIVEEFLDLHRISGRKSY